MAGKPAVPFLLGSLLSSHEPNMQTDGAALETDTSSPYSFGELDDDGFQMEARETSAAETAPALVNPGRSEEDFSLLDLSDEELELLIDKESAAETEATGALWAIAGSELVQAAEPAPSAFETSPPRDEHAGRRRRTIGLWILTIIRMDWIANRKSPPATIRFLNPLEAPGDLRKSPKVLLN